MKHELDNNRPIYIQIKEIIEDAILNDSIKVGEKVPSTNELAKFYQINPATTRQGMNELVDREILVKQRGVGMFVSAEAKEISIVERKEEFYTSYIVPLREDAEKLNISVEQLEEMLKRT